MNNFEKTLSLLFESKLPYDEWLVVNNQLNKEVDDASFEVNRIAGKNNGGLTPADVRSSKAFKDANKKFSVVFKKLQRFNLCSPKEFKRQKTQDRRANRFRDKS